MTDDPVRTAARLGALRTRGQTYAFLAGVVCTMLVTALAIPFIAGSRTTAGGPISGTATFETVPPSGRSGLDALGDAPSTTILPDGTTAAVAADGSILSTSALKGSTPNSQGGSALAGRPGASPAPRSPTESTIALRASDQGVTPSRIKVGAIVTDLGGTSSLGFKPTGYDPDTQKKYFQAQIDDLNTHGGLLGRQIDIVYKTVDILSQDSMRTACAALADDEKVFAVLHVLGVYGDPILCFTQQKGLPYVAFDGASSDYYGRSGGLLVTTQPSTKRTSLDMARRLFAAGALTGKKIGILRYAEYLDGDMTALIDYTRSLGLDVTDAVISISNTGAVPGQLAVAVNRFQTAGVGMVFLMTNTLYGQQFVSQADRQQFYPAYGVSDFDYASAGNTFVSGMPDAFFKSAAYLVTSTRTGDDTFEAPVDKACTAIGSAAAAKPLTPKDGDFYGYLGACGVFRTFVQGVSRAGMNPTRAAFAKAVQTVGTYPNPGFAESSLATGKLGAGSAVRIDRADITCKCWRVVSSYEATGFKGS